MAEKKKDEEKKNEKHYCIRCEMNEVSGIGEKCWFCKMKQERVANGEQIVNL